MLKGSNCIILDLETARSADDCRHCGKELTMHYADGACTPWTGDRPGDDITQWSKIGWDNKQDLGLGIGCYFDYTDDLYHWFDRYTLEATMRFFVERSPLLVSFNGIQFDFPLMRSLLRGEAERSMLLTDGSRQPREAELVALCDAFKALCAISYDVLAEIWKRDPARKFERGLNSLGALSVANGYGMKEMDGAQAPQLWRQGRYAEVIAYNVSDVLKTKKLFEQIVTTGQLVRGDGQPIVVPLPPLTQYGGGDASP